MSPCDLNTEDLSPIIATAFLVLTGKHTSTRRNANHFTE